MTYWALKCDYGYVVYDFNLSHGMVYPSILAKALMTTTAKENIGGEAVKYAKNILKVSDLKWVKMELVTKGVEEEC